MKKDTIITRTITLTLEYQFDVIASPENIEEETEIEKESLMRDIFENPWKYIDIDYYDEEVTIEH